MTALWRLVSDGSMAYPREFIFTNAEPGELESAGVGDEVVTSYDCLLVETGSRTVLVDAGSGPAAQPSAGRLLGALADAGFSTDDVDVVVITHAHPDHVGGLAPDGRPAFGRARHYIAAAEAAFWTSADARSRLPDALADTMISSARGALGAIEDAGLLEQVEPPASILPGLTLVPAPGHTPGHLAVEVTGSEPLLYLADALLHELHFEHLGWTSVVDIDPVVTADTRRALLDRAADTDMLVAGFHLGRTGHVARHGDGYRLSAVSGSG